MKIESEPKLDFNNVLIRPKRTILKSRSEVDIEREFTFPHSTSTWKGVPIIASNMDTIGTFEVYHSLKKHKIVTALHKFYTLEDYQNCDNNWFEDSEKVKEFNNWFEDSEKVKEFISKGIAKYELQDYQKAIDDFSEALKLFPEDKEALKKRSEAYQKLSEIDLNTIEDLDD